MPGALLQRCACGKKTSGPEGEECPECKKKREAGARLQRKAAPAGRAASTMAPPIVHDVLRSSGQPLDAATRAFMEPRFGYDFSRVRLHADAQAARSAEAVSAQAYTVGSNIVLGANRGGVGDRRLLAHELAHVVQQDGRQAGGVLAVAPANDSAEVAADRAADQVLSGGPAGRPSKSDGRLQRLGANPGCTPAQAASIHQGIYDANSMVGKALSALAARPLASRTVSALAHNFGPAGTLGNVPTIEARLKAGRSDMLSDPLSCVTAATDANCGGGYCGDTPVPGGHAANICADVTLAPPLDSIYRAGCVLHEAMHASNGSIIGDYYSGWFHHSTPTAVYPGPDPLNNADSYVTLAMELS
ncbi:MAG TPA: DUF4157 domain-containing protein [Opitutaceae bacterium]|nr:DUF4157 domain-containing protein [Opitutaceae bacterium]